jgi:uncharacterized membrane protein YdjX (TVP38/TMEM64 family)
VDANPILAAGVYVLAYVAAVALSFPGASFLTAIGGFMFGSLVGTALALVSATIGATAIFLIARTSVGDLLASRAGPRMQRLRAGFDEEGFSYLLFLRLVPLFPFWVVNLAAALFECGSSLTSPRPRSGFSQAPSCCPISGRASGRRSRCEA